MRWDEGLAPQRRKQLYLLDLLVSLNSQPTVLAPQTTILILELFNIYRMIERIDRLKTTEIRPLTRLFFYVLRVFFFLALQEVISASVLALRETDAPAEIVV